MNPLIQLKKAAPVFFVALVCFGFLPTMQAVSPTPDGGYPGGNTAEGGSGALFSLTTGTNNTAVGSSALFSLTTGIQNTAVGAQALKNNTANDNTAEGFQALVNNTTGFGNTATGWRALFQNTTGFHNTADGFSALLRNTVGNHNTASGDEALGSNTTGNFNTTDGAHSLENNITGSGNTALGFGAGDNVTTANNVICIGSGVEGANVSNSCYIGSVFGQTSSVGTAVFINSSGKLGTITSSRRFKEEIKPMAQASEGLFALKPVIFRYKKEIEPQKIPQFGLVAEDVEAVNPDLVVRDADGKAYAVRYEAVNAMLLNEFLKEHRTVGEQKATIAQLKQDFAEQQRQIEALTAGLQKVSAQLEVSKPAPQMVLSNQ
jgi:trimeric autotransporter adhesin